MAKKLEGLFVKVPVTIFRENEQYVAYSPALDLSTCGKSYEQATKRFNEAAEIFFEETKEKGTLREALEELGWEIKEKKISPPVVVSHGLQELKISYA